MTNTPISFDVLHGTKFWFFLIIIFIWNIMNLFILHYLLETGLQSTADWVEVQRQTVPTAFVGGDTETQAQIDWVVPSCSGGVESSVDYLLTSALIYKQNKIYKQN